MSYLTFLFSMLSLQNAVCILHLHLQLDGGWPSYTRGCWVRTGPSFSSMKSHVFHNTLLFTVS